jgi:prophage maintenance system killer protein
MIEFGVCDLVLAASRTLGLGTDATVDLLDLAAAEAALAEAALAESQILAETQPPGARDDLAAAAAGLLYALVLSHPFRRGNDRVALVAAAQLLAMRGWRVNLDPPGATMSIITGIGAGEVGAPELWCWLLPRLYRESESRRWEAKMRKLLPGRRRRTRRASTSGPVRFERFTDRARRVVVLAHEEARMLNHNYIGTEHILLGLIHEGEGVAAKALESLGISLEAVRQQVEEIIGQGQQAPSGHIPFTPRAKKVLQLSREEALNLGHNYIGTEHILLGLIREGGGVAAQVLVKLGADLNRVRQQVTQLLNGYQGKEPAAAGPPSETASDPTGQSAATLRSEVERQRREITRLNGLLRQHGIEPGGDQQSA